MINLTNELPTLQLGNGVVAIEAHWLEHSLEEAAASAGYDHWLPAEHVAQTVTAHLMMRNTREPVSLEGFALTVRGVLEGIGYGEVAPFFLRSGLELGLSLMDVAERGGVGFELGFFKELDRAIDRLFACEILKKVSFIDTVPAVKVVLKRKKWSPVCDLFRDEVVAVIRYQVARRAGSVPLLFSIN